MKNLTRKQAYLQPQIEVIEVQNEAGVMVGSDLPNINDGGSIFKSTSSGTTRTGTKHQAGNPLQELEDMLNDILTY